MCSAVVCSSVVLVGVKYRRLATCRLPAGYHRIACCSAWCVLQCRTQRALQAALCSQPLTLWFVLRLSICFLKTACQKSLHRNFMMSRVSLSRALSLLYLRGKNMPHTGTCARQTGGWIHACTCCLVVGFHIMGMVDISEVLCAGWTAVSLVRLLSRYRLCAKKHCILCQLQMIGSLP